MLFNSINNHTAGNGILTANGHDNVGISFAGLDKGLVLKPSPRTGKGDHDSGG